MMDDMCFYIENDHATMELLGDTQSLGNGVH